MPPKPKAKSSSAAEQSEAKPAELASEVRKRTIKLIASLNSKFDAERKKIVSEATSILKAALAKKTKDGKPDGKDLAQKTKFMEAAIPVYKAGLSRMRVSAAKRSGEDQAWLAIKGWSKTCRSAHMHHAAIHVNITVTKGGKSKDIGIGDISSYFPGSFKASDHVYKSSWAIMSIATFKKAWEAGMKKAALADYTGKTQKFQPGDPWHVELPTTRTKGVDKKEQVKGSRPTFSDKEVIACIDHYAEYAAHVDAIDDVKLRNKHSKNTKIEKNYPKTYKAKYKVHKKKLDAAKKKVAADSKKKKKVQEDITKKVKTIKTRMDKSYKELIKLEADAKANKTPILAQP